MLAMLSFGLEHIQSLIGFRTEEMGVWSGMLEGKGNCIKATFILIIQAWKKKYRPENVNSSNFILFNGGI